MVYWLRNAQFSSISQKQSFGLSNETVYRQMLLFLWNNTLEICVACTLNLRTYVCNVLTKLLGTSYIVSAWQPSPKNSTF